LGIVCFSVTLINVLIRRNIMGYPVTIRKDDDSCYLCE